LTPKKNEPADEEKYVATLRAILRRFVAVDPGL
jgi:hypothetical protein